MRLMRPFQSVVSVISKRGSAMMLVAVIAVGGLFSLTNSIADAATGVLDDKAYLVINPSNNSSALVNDAQLATFKNNGYTDTKEAFLVSNESGSGLYPIYRLFKASSKDYLMTASSNERNSAVTKYGYQDDGIAFYARTSDNTETEPVARHVKGSLHRTVLDGEQSQALVVAGWRREGVSFYAKLIPVTTPTTPTVPTTPTDPRDGDGKFTLAIMPDTQQEALDFAGDQFAERTNWLMNQVGPRDIRFIAHTGDIVSAGGNSTDTANLYQWQRASDAFKTIDQGTVPYLLSVGNHDTAAVCGGGAACTGQNTKVNIRDTSVLNRFFPDTRLKLTASNEFEANKIDNSYKTFDAEGTKWLVLSLEMLPRKTAVDWAKAIVAAHPDRNVIVISHFLLNADGTIATSTEGYGEVSGQYIYDNLILKYPNVKLAFSGHKGLAATRTDTGVNGNKVASFVGTFHSNDYNPTRIVTVDVNANTVMSDIQAATVRDAYKAKYPTAAVPTYDEYDVSYADMNLIK